MIEQSITDLDKDCIGAKPTSYEVPVLEVRIRGKCVVDNALLLNTSHVNTHD